MTAVNTAAATVGSRLEFLREAAHLLAIPAPTISAGLGAARDTLLNAQDGNLQMSRHQLDILHREFCGACGCLLIPGWSSQVSCGISNSQTGSKNDKSKASSRLEKDAVYNCLKCGRRNSFPIPSKPAKHLKTPARGIIDTESTTKTQSNESSKVTKSASAGSKQRKRARKGGLQAMLDKNKTQTSRQGGIGLDLMDFMQ